MPPKPQKTIQQLVSELKSYPAEAFVFIQECVGSAADYVHGPLEGDQLKVAQWMAQNEVGPEELRQLSSDGNLPPEIAEAMFNTGGVEKMNRHVTGQQLCWAVRDAALTRWGMMARGVLARWNICATQDIGAIIFALVTNDWLQKQPTDTIEDFDNVFSFDEAFDQYRIGAT
jgi:uncharacterized repeat protein (TIGR04138 family)